MTAALTWAWAHSEIYPTTKQAAVTDLEIKETKNKVNGTHYLVEDDDGFTKAEIQVTPVGNSYFISDFRVAKPYRGEGLGTKLMQHILDKHDGHTMYLEADPYDDPEMTKAQLKKYYKKFGFKSAIGDSMVLFPDKE